MAGRLTVEATVADTITAGVSPTLAAQLRVTLSPSSEQANNVLLYAVLIYQNNAANFNVTLQWYRVSALGDPGTVTLGATIGDPFTVFLPFDSLFSIPILVMAVDPQPQGAGAYALVSQADQPAGAATITFYADALLFD